MATINSLTLKIFVVCVLGISPLFSSWMEEDSIQQDNRRDTAVLNALPEAQVRQGICKALSKRLLKVDREERGLFASEVPAFEVEEFSNILFKLSFSTEELKGMVHENNK